MLVSSSLTPCRFSRFAIFFIDHSTPDSGFLHIGPKNTGSAPVDVVCLTTSCIELNTYVSAPQVLSWLFPERFKALLRKGKDNLMFLLTCGGLVTHPTSLCHLKEFSKE